MPWLYRPSWYGRSISRTLACSSASRSFCSTRPVLLRSQSLASSESSLPCSLEKLLELLEQSLEFRGVEPERLHGHAGSRLEDLSEAGEEQIEELVEDRYVDRALHHRGAQRRSSMPCGCRDPVHARRRRYRGSPATETRTPFLRSRSENSMSLSSIGELPHQGTSAEDPCRTRLALAWASSSAWPRSRAARLALCGCPPRT